MKVKIKSLKLDESIYPRHKVSKHHVGNLKTNILAGAKLPDVIFDKSTKTVVDGFHRITAYKELYGDDYEINAKAIICKDKGEILLESAKINSKHGLKLSAWDMARCINIAEANKISKQLMQEALSITPGRYDSLFSRIVEIRDLNGNSSGHTELKRGQMSIAKKGYITEQEAEIIDEQTTGLSKESRIFTLITDIELGNLKVTKKNISLIQKLYNLLGDIIDDFEK